MSVSASRAARAKRAAGMALLILGCTMLFTLSHIGEKRPSRASLAEKDMKNILSTSKLLLHQQARSKLQQSLAREGLSVLAEEGEEEKPEGGEGKEEGEGGEGGEEEGEKMDEEAENAIKTRWGFAFVTIIIVFSVSFEYSVEFIKEKVPEDLHEVVAALLEELTTLGFLGFAFFITTVPIGGSESLIAQASIYSLHEPEALEELFEGLHYLVFFVSLSFIMCTVLGLYHFQWTGNAAWIRYEEKGLELMSNSKEDPEEKVRLLEIEPEHLNAEGSLLKEWRKPDEVHQAEYLRIRLRFIHECEEVTLANDFPFHTYLQKRASEVFSGMIKITAVDWLATWLLLSLFFGVVQEGVTADRLLALYWFLLLMITALCLLLQAKVVWIKQQLIPRLPSEMQSAANRTNKIVCPPVYKDQSTFSTSSYIPKGTPAFIHSFLKQALNFRIGTKQERLFWFSSQGPAIMSHLIRLSMFWSVISLAMLLSHHMPGVVHLGVELFGHVWTGWVIFIAIVIAHGVAIAIIYVTARVFTLTTSIEMLVDEELLNAVVRDQKYEKCQKAIEMLYTLHFYVQQLQALEQQAADLEAEDAAGRKSIGSATPRSVVFEAKTEEEEKAYEELKQLFELYDADASGNLSTEEVGELLGTMGLHMVGTQLDNLIRLMDKDGSGDISLDELAAVMISRAGKKEVKLSEIGEQLFQMFDKDGEGEISLDEMIATLEGLGKNWDMEDIKTFFAVLDADGGGTVDKQEFMDFIADVEALAK